MFPPARLHFLELRPNLRLPVLLLCWRWVDPPLYSLGESEASEIRHDAGIPEEAFFLTHSHPMPARPCTDDEIPNTHIVQKHPHLRLGKQYETSHF